MSDGKIEVPATFAADAAIDAPTCPSLPMVDDETLEAFLSEPRQVGLLPVKPEGFRREFQRLIVSAYLHELAVR
jgi:hypothetical protein